MTRHALLAIVFFVATAGCGAAPTLSEAAPASVAASPGAALVDALIAPGACFARVYDPAHLAAHPRQTVTRFALSDPGADWRATQTPGHFNLAFGFQLTSGADVYSGVGICQPDSERVNCDIEGDGGSFSITANGDGLRITVSRMQVEGQNDFSPDLAEADNRIMLLRRADAGACAGNE
jgi:hypothetical protein